MDSALVEQCLARFVRHADLARVALAGSLAMHAQLHGLTSWRGEADDIDFVASGPESIRPSVTGDFLVSHYHLPAVGYRKFLIQLVDPSTRLRLDVFPDTNSVLPRAVTARVAGVELLVLRLQDILEHKLAILARASEEHPADPKHLQDAELIGQMSARTVPTIVPSRLAPAVYSQDRGRECTRCDASRSAAFALAPKHDIMDILGYV